MKTSLIGKVLNLAAWVVILGSAGCATKIPSYTGTTAPPSRAGSAQGLVMKADPFTDRERTATYFKLDPSEKGMAIIHLRADNLSTDAVWLLTEQKMALVDSSTAVNQGVKNDLTSYNTVGMVGAALISLPLLQAGYTQTFIEKNLVDKEWRNQTLSPGQCAEGFLYFNVGKSPDWTRKMSLRIEGVNVRNQQTNVFFVPLAYEKK